MSDFQPDPALAIEEVARATDEVVAALRRLVPQLSPAAPPPTLERVAELVASDHQALLVARLPEAEPSIVGTLTLVAYPLPSGLRVWIEDVVVDAAARGRGVGAALVRTALRRAEQMGAPAVNLTSNPRREAANRLYRRLGFTLRETNAYRYLFHS